MNSATSFYLDDDGDWNAIVIAHDGQHIALRVDNADFDRLSIVYGLSYQTSPDGHEWVYLKGGMP